MRSRGKHVPDDSATYLPIGLRPAPYPAGFGASGRWSGDRLVRVVVTGSDPDGGMPPAEPAPLPGGRPTGTRSTQMRWVQADELPVAGPMAVAEAVSDDPGWLSIHGPRLRGEYGPGGPGGRGPGDLGGNAGRRRGRHVPIGAVLVSRRAESSSERRGWNIWRVLPGGPVAVLEASVGDTASGTDKVEIARRIDRDLRAAFAEAADRLELTDSPHAGRVRTAVGAWQVAEAAPTPSKKGGSNRRRRRGGR